MYKLQLSSQAKEFYDKLYFSDRSHFTRIDASLESLKKDPFQGKQLKHDFKGMYSLRVGVYRIIYEVHRDKIIIFISRIGHRREVYQ